MALGDTTKRLARTGEYGAAAGILIKVAHSLYWRWEGMDDAHRERLRELAHEVKDSALDLRGRLDRPAAETGLRKANEDLAAAIVGSAETDPTVSDEELRDLRAELTRELARFASGEGGRRSAA